MSDFIHNVPIKVPNKSGFDFDFENAFTGKCGALVPALVKEVLPNDTVSIGVVSQVQLPPLVADAIGRIEMVYEAFFVPSRLCWRGWSAFMTHPTANPQYPVGYPEANKISRVPSFDPMAQSWLADPDEGTIDGDFQYFFPSGGLADMLGLRFDIPSTASAIVEGITTVGQRTYFGTKLEPFSVLPFVAYHLIWDNWYRDSRVQAPVFYEQSFYGNNVPDYSRMMSYLPSIGNIQVPDTEAQYFSSNLLPLFTQDGNYSDHDKFLDGSSIFDLRQRNWAKDYFTSASTYPQASVVGSTVDFSVVDGEGSFSIAALRAANSVQQWLERNNLAGYRYADQIYAQFGIYPSDAIMDRPLYLGRYKHFIYNRSVFQQTPSVMATGRNPFEGNVGAKFGSAQGIGDGSIIDSFTSSEHGFIFVLASMVPRAYYGQGRSRMFDRLEIGDFAFPLLANMGDQMIRKSELLGYSPEDNNFGYTDLYAEYKVSNDEIHGHLRDNESLQHFAIQRSFEDSENLEISSEFLQIPTDFLDQILAIETDLVGATYWCDCFFKFKKVSTLPVYSQPTLMDLQNGHVEHITRGGKRL